MNRIKNNSAKILTIFLVIAVVLAVSIAATAIFFFQTEINQRKEVEADLKKSNIVLAAIQKEVDQTKEKNSFLEAKNKEADDKINSLLDELELEEGLKDEMKLEIASLKEELEITKEAKEKAEMKISDGFKDTEARIVELEAKLTKEINQKLALENKLRNLKQVAIEQQKVVQPIDLKQAEEIVKQDQEEVRLEKIVVVPDTIPEGRVLSVDTDTEFIIVNLGEKDGIRQGNVMSVYRGKEYLGDVRITRIQPEMSAADLIPPFSAQIIRKNDQVIAK